MSQVPEDTILPFFNFFKFFKKRMKKRLHKGYIPFNVMQIGLIHYIKKQRTAVSMRELAEFLEITPPSATAMIDKLVDINFLKREYDKKDRRTILISITEKGMRKFRKAEKEKREIFEEMLNKINKEEKNKLFEILKKMTSEAKK
jgi:DNA-binding MarR family transcriptional regulator